MRETKFRALVAVKEADGRFSRAVRERTVADLPAGDVLIQVHYSSLNYKDALSAAGNQGVTRQYPHTPGVDAAGIVVESSDSKFKAGDEVVVTGYDLGMNTDGGFGQYIRVPAGWVVFKPKRLTFREAMIYGTAGFTAVQSVSRLVNHGVGPEKGEVLVTGASGGVGSLALATLAQLGYGAVGLSGKPEAAEFLKKLGAVRVLDRKEFIDESTRPLLKPRWSGVVDTVGGATLPTALKTVDYRGCVTCCGNVGGPDFTTSVYPFILRGIALYGIDSANCPMPARLRIWEKIGGEWKLDRLDLIARECDLDQLDEEIGRILESRQMGRVVVRMTG